MKKEKGKDMTPRKRLLTSILLIVAFVFATAFLFAGASDEALPPPMATKIPKADTLFGDVRVDDYYWLRDRTDPDVIDYLEAENDYTDSIMKPTAAMQENLFKEMVARIKETDLSAPEKIDDYYYYYRTEQGKEYRIQCRKRGNLDGSEEVFFDENEVAKGHDYFDVGSLRVSPDHRLLAYTTDTSGSENYTVFIKDLNSGALLADTITHTGGIVVWANDNKTLFYDVLDETMRPYRVYRHTLGDSQNKDVLVYEEPDKSFYLGIGKTKSKAYILIELGSKMTTEIRYLPADNPAAPVKLIEPRRHGIEYYMTHHDTRFFVLTNENAKNFKLMETPAADPSKSNWKEVIPHRSDVLLEAVDAFRDRLVVLQRRDGLPQVQIRGFVDTTSYLVNFPEPTYSIVLGRNSDFNTAILRFTYESLVTPRSVFDFDMNTRQRELKKTDEVLGGYDPTEYLSERLFAVASDGTRIPISLVYKKSSFRKDGTNPLYLHGYGAYGLSTDPWFSTSRLSLLNRGFIWAIAHVRGGGEMGRQWYDDGKLLKKKNTYTDFIACAEYLIREKFTAKEKLVINGGSAGGLLVGAVVSMRPDLCGLVVADVPFVDVLNTMLDASIPLTVTEYEEWGNPNEKQYYEYMKSYAPYENVEARSYPNILITASINDPRVAYWEPAKWCARLRAAKTDHNLLLLKTNMGAGHGGASGRYERLKEIAFEDAFIFKVLGIKP